LFPKGPTLPPRRIGRVFNLTSELRMGRGEDKYIYSSLYVKTGNACYHSVQNLLSSQLLSKNLKIRIYKTIILPAVLYGCETWSLTLMEEHRLVVFENGAEEDIWTEER
jgi:hypothetical protein